MLSCWSRETSDAVTLEQCDIQCCHVGTVGHLMLSCWNRMASDAVMLEQDDI